MAAKAFKAACKSPSAGGAASSGPMIEKSLAWLRAALKELGIQEAE